MGQWSYREWDGSQRDQIDAMDRAFDALVDDLLAHGDSDAALRRVINAGFDGPDGERTHGLQQLMQRLRDARKSEMDRTDPTGQLARSQSELDQILAEERRALDELQQRADGNPDDRRYSETSTLVAEHQMQLELMPPDVAGRVEELQRYDFVSPEAKARFESLVDELRKDIASGWFDRMSSALSDMDPAHLEETRRMFDRLNRMLEQRRAGEELDPAFEQFMAEFGQFFPSSPSTLDELLEEMAAQMAAAEAALGSMTPEQRSQLQSLASSLFEDLDLSFQIDRLSANLRELAPGAGWDRSRRFDRHGGHRGEGGFGQAARSARRLGEIEDLQNFLGSATSPGQLSEVDPEIAERYLGGDGAESLARLARLARELEEAGLIDTKEGRYTLTPQAIRKIGQRALGDLFEKVTRDRSGDHLIGRQGSGHQHDGRTKPFEPGDAFAIDIQRTVHNAVRRAGSGTPVRLAPEDFEVAATEAVAHSSTVVMIDLSLSMPMEGNFVPAKKIAMALHSLITSLFPRDDLWLVGFSDVAREIKPESLPEVSWDYVHGTNMQHGFMIARRLLAHKSGTKQIIMITDGEPTAHLEVTAAGEDDVFFCYPPAPATLAATLAEVARCTKAGITINTFMLNPDRGLAGFVEQMTRLNRGRAFVTSPDDLGSYVLVDFLARRRGHTGRRSA